MSITAGNTFAGQHAQDIRDIVDYHRKPDPGHVCGLCPGMARCWLCRGTFPAGELNRHGECAECADAAEGSWGF